MIQPIIQNGSIYYKSNGAITIEAPKQDSVLTVGDVVIKIPKGWSITVSEVEAPKIDLIGTNSHCLMGNITDITVIDSEGENLIVNSAFDNKEW